MKTYNQLITELNKFEKMMIKKGLKSLVKSKPTKSLVKGLKDAMMMEVKIGKQVTKI